MVKSRHAGRELALKELYSNEIQNNISVSDSLEHKATREPKDLSQLFSFLLPEERSEYDESILVYASWLVNSVLENIDDINAKILTYSRGRTLERISPVDLSILRLSIATLLFDKSVHPSIVIDEAVKLSQSYSNEVNYKFINGVLDAFVRSGGMA